MRWASESLSYVKKAIADVERELAEADMKLIPNAKTPLASGYRPELDTSPELGSKQLNYFQGLIGILRWICELGRIVFYARFHSVSIIGIGAVRASRTDIPYIRIPEDTLAFNDGL